MRRSIKVTLAAAVAAGTVAAAARAEAPTAEAIAAGEYLTYAGGCGSCHTAPGGPPFAGGVGLLTPYGVLRAPNITPDVETGIGDWTRDDFARALHEGIRKGGMPLFPAMPYNHYTKTTDADVDALWAFISTRAPAKNAVEVDELSFPFDLRAAQIGWQALFFTPGRFQPDPAATEEQNRGAYLVEALAHCSACHSPHSALGVEEADRYLQGGSVEPWWAPDISNGPNSALRDYTVDSLVAYLSGGTDGANRRAVGPMAEVVFDNLIHFTPEDVRAIAVYLTTRKPEPAAEPAAAAPALVVPEASRVAGGEVYLEHCATCHGKNGEGVAGVAARLADVAAVEDGPPDNAIAILLQGAPAQGEWNEMPSFAAALTDAEIADVSNYIRTSWGNAATVAANPDMVARARTMTDRPAASIASSILCPVVPESHMDAETRTALAGLDPAAIDGAKLSEIVAAYTAKYATLPPSVRHIALIGAFCADKVAAGADPKEIARDQGAFVLALDKATN
jgi:mono/diheme cytochrome c family protein